MKSIFCFWLIIAVQWETWCFKGTFELLFSSCLFLTPQFHYLIKLLLVIVIYAALYKISAASEQWIFLTGKKGTHGNCSIWSVVTFTHWKILAHENVNVNYNAQVQTLAFHLSPPSAGTPKLSGASKPQLHENFMPSNPLTPAEALYNRLWIIKC